MKFWSILVTLTFGVGWSVLFTNLAEASRRPEKRSMVDVNVLGIFKPTQVILRGPLMYHDPDGLERRVPRVSLEATPDGLLVDGERILGGVTFRPEVQAITVSVMNGGQVARMERDYQGPLTIRQKGKSLQLVARLELEDYVAGVLASELPSGGSEARKAQAILIRTYALQADKRHAEADVCDLTHCQTYKGVPDEQTRSLVQSTRGLVVKRDRGLADVYYSSTCGGHTLDAMKAWPRGESTTGSRGVPDRSRSGKVWCEASPHFSWQVRLSRTELYHVLKERWSQLKPDFRLTLKYDASGWVERVGLSEQEESMTGEAFHLIMGRALGWGSFKSAHFQMHQSADGTFDFKGRGLGHGVGLCQHGALAQAESGKSAREILKHYFPEWEVGPWE